MNFNFLTIELTGLTLLIYFICAIISWAIFYYTIKAAVKNGITESRFKNEISTLSSKPEIKPNQEQEKLQSLYDRGQISFEEYQKEWTKKA